MKTQMEFYDFKTLQRIAMDRGYVTTRAIADALEPAFGTSTKTIMKKLEYGNLTKEQCEVIGDLFEMSPKEYYETFMRGFFKMTPNGKFICEVENPAYHVRYSNTAQKEEHKRKRREKRTKELLEEIENL